MYLPKFSKESNRNIFIVTLFAATLVNYLTFATCVPLLYCPAFGLSSLTGSMPFLTSIHHYHFGLLFLVVAGMSYLLHRRCPGRDLHAFVFWFFLISGVFAIAMDINHFL